MVVCEGCGTWNKRVKLEERCRNDYCYKNGQALLVVKSKYNEGEDERQKALSICRHCKKVYHECRCDWKEKLRLERFEKFKV